MIKTINSFRFILILMIVMSHSLLPISQGMKDYLGEFPVAMFFIISGFVLSLSYGERLVKEEVSNKRFFLTRISKLYPLHLFVLAIIIPLDYRLGLLGPWYQTLAHALLLQCWMPTHQFGGALNGPTWFISDLIIYYLIFKYLYRWNMQSKKTFPLIIHIHGCIHCPHNDSKRRQIGRLYLCSSPIPHNRLLHWYLTLSILSLRKRPKSLRIYCHQTQLMASTPDRYCHHPDIRRNVLPLHLHESQLPLCCPLLVAVSSYYFLYHRF